MNDNDLTTTDAGDTLATVHEILVAIHEAADDPEKVRRLAAEALDLFDATPGALH